MVVSEVMTANPISCYQQDTQRNAAKVMSELNCGILPVLNGQLMLVGVITDRDICCRAVAEGRDIESSIDEFMSQPVVSVQSDDTLEKVCELMKQHQIRRIPVIDADSACRGIVSIMDVAPHVDRAVIGETVQQIMAAKVYVS